MCATLAGPLRSDSLRVEAPRLRPARPVRCQHPSPFLRTILGWVRTHGRKEGECVAEITPLALPVLSPPAVDAGLSVPCRRQRKAPIDMPLRRAQPEARFRASIIVLGVVALDRDRCSTQSETPAPTAIPTTASKRSRARKAQLSWYSPLTTVAAKAQAKTPITASTARSQPEVLRQSSHPRTALEMRGKNSSIWFPSLALVRVDQSLSRTSKLAPTVVTVHSIACALRQRCQTNAIRSSALLRKIEKAHVRGYRYFPPFLPTTARVLQRDALAYKALERCAGKSGRDA